MNRHLFLLEVLGLISLLQSQHAESVASIDDSEDVDTLTADNFNQEVANNNLFVLFYGSGCPECDELALTWKKLAKHFDKNNKPNKSDINHRNETTTISFAKANCSIERALCTEKCSWNEYRKCTDGPETHCNMDKAYNPRKWMKTLIDAKKVCEKHPDCGGITRDNGGYEPRKGPKIGKFEGVAHELWLCKVSQSKNGSKCSHSDHMGISCRCPSDCRVCENCASSRFILESGYPTLMFFEAGQIDGVGYEGPRDFDTLRRLINLKTGQGPPTVKNQSVLLIEAGCKIQEWEYGEWDTKLDGSKKDRMPIRFHWKSTGKLLATGVCILNDYEKDFPPDDGTKKIYSTIEAHEVRGVDAKKKTLSIDFTLTMRWLDSRIKTNFYHLTNKVDGILLGPKAVDQIWYPDLEVLNRQAFKIKEEWASLITTRILTEKHINELDGMNDTEYQLSIPTVEMKYDVKTTVYCKKWIYSNYPMDNQTCDVAFGSLSGSSVFTLYKTPGNDVTPHTYKAADFNITVTYFDRDEKHGVGMTVMMRRLTTSFFMKYYGPCIAIVLVSEIGFIIPVTAIPGRVGLLVTQFLTLINLFIHQMSESPSQSELNALGIYLLACLGFVVCGLLEFAITLLIHQRRNSRKESKNANQSENKKNESIPSILSQQERQTSSAVAAWQPKKSNSKEIVEIHPFRRLMTEIWKRISTILPSCDIDVMAGCIYLMVFALFNCVYWSSFGNN